MNTAPFELVDRAIDLANLDSGDLRTYSGRGMYGAECIGLKCGTMADVYAFVTALGQVYQEALADAVHHEKDGPDFEPIEFAESTRTDNIGLNVIAYWPGWKLDDA